MVETTALADPLWRLSNLYSISDEDSQTVLFWPNKVQSHILQRMQDRMIILKARQHGVTTFFCVYYLDQVLWNENTWACIIAHNRETLGSIFRKIQFAWDKLDPVLKEQIGTPEADTKYELFWRNRNSKIYVALKTEGCTNQFLHFSEYAQVPDQYVAISTPTAERGMIVKESTAYGLGNRMDGDWKAAKAGKIPDIPLFYEWWWSPKYRMPVTDVAQENLTLEEDNLIKHQGLDAEQIQWRRTMWADQQQPNGTNLFPQNYAEDDISCFMSSGDAAFDNGALEINRNFLVRQPPACLKAHVFIGDHKRVQVTETKNGATKIYEMPQHGMQYVAGGDVSLGSKHGDFQTVQILRRDNLRQVAVYKNKTELPQFARDTVALCKLYNEAWLCPERNAIGEAYIRSLLEMYPRRKIYQRDDMYTKVNVATATKYGYYTSGGYKGKIMLVSHAQNFIASGYYLIDLETVEQMMEFQQYRLDSTQQTGRMGYRGAQHDDLIIAFCLALEMHSTLPAFKSLFRPEPDAWDDVRNKKRRDRDNRPMSHLVY